jgi:PAS domain S-box-containing protein
MALKREITAKIKDLLRQHPQGLSITEIVRNLDINRNTAGRYLENLMVSGQVEMRHFGMAKIYRLAQRVPLSAMLSISSQMIMLLDSSMRVIYANEPLLQFLGTSQKDLYGKNIEFTPCLTVFDDVFDALKKHVGTGLTGKEWSGELPIRSKDTIFSCRIAPAVFEEGQRGVSVLLEDITERKRTEQKVQESERQFRQLAEQSTDMIVRLARDGTCRYISPACRTILGFRPAEILRRSLNEVLHPDDVHLFAKVQAQLTKEHPVTTAELRIRHRDGYYVWIEASIRAIFDNRTRALVETYSIGREITTRKLAEEALRESEERYRSFVQSFHGIAYRGRMDFVPVFFHGAVEEITGYREKDFLAGKPRWDQLIHPDDLREIQKSFSDLRTCPHTSTEREYRIVRREGGVRWIHEHIRNICDETGRPAFVQGALYDVTDRKNAQEALRESEDRYRTLAEISPDAIIVHRDGMILYVNPAALTLIGASHSDQIIGKNVLDFILPGFRDAVRMNIQKDLMGERTPPLELHMLRMDGTSVIVEGRGVGTLIGGQPAIQVAIRDITDRKKVEAALKESEQKYRDIFEKSVVGLFRTAPDGRLIDANDALARMYGYSGAAEMVAAVPDVGRHYANPEERRKVLDTLAKKGVVENYETLHLKRDGARFWVSITVRIIRNTDGTVLFYEGSNIDITGRKRAEEALRQSEARFRSYFDMPLHGRAITSPEKGWLEVNDQICSILGYTRDEIVRMTWAEMTHPDDLAADSEQFDRIISGEIEQYTLDKRFIRNDGRVIWTSIAVGCVRKPDGTVDYIVGLMEDITDRKRAEEALSQSEATARALINAPTDSILLLDPEGVILELNETAARRLGRQRNELIGAVVDTVLPEEIARARRSAIFRILETKKPIRFEDERDGIWFDTVVYPIISDGGEVNKIAIIARDITDRRRIEEALRESEENYRNLIERANDGICVIQDGVVKFCNRRITEFWGGSVQETLGRNFTDFVHPDAIPEITDLYERRMAGETVPSIYDTKLKRKDGSIFYAEVNAGIVTYGGKPGDLIIIRDINDRKKTEEELRKKSQEL